jgi:F-type H+-transporting ATPase subunit b
MTLDWWTLAIQSVNVLVLAGLLRHFFWRPIADAIEARRAAEQRLLDDALAKQQAADAALVGIAQIREGMAAEREEILKAARAEAERLARSRLDAAAAEIETMRAAAHEALVRERAETSKALAGQASHLAVDIAVRLAARLDGTAVRASFLDWLVAEVGRLPEDTRRILKAEGFTLVSAAALTPEEQTRCRQALGITLGSEPAITFQEEPALIAGLELRGASLLISNSWRADLARILAEGHDAGKP